MRREKNMRRKGFLVFFTVAACLVIVSALYAGDSPLGSIKEGWNGLQWGASPADFSARFPKATLPDQPACAVTGEGKEQFLGFLMEATYVFIAEKFSGVVLEIDGVDTTSMQEALSKSFGQPNRADKGEGRGWSDGDTMIFYEAYGSKVLISIIHSVSEK
jgi:hypothetical protein